MQEKKSYLCVIIIHSLLKSIKEELSSIHISSTTITTRTISTTTLKQFLTREYLFPTNLYKGTGSETVLIIAIDSIETASHQCAIRIRHEPSGAALFTTTF